MPQGFAQTYASIEAQVVIAAKTEDDVRVILDGLADRNELEITGLAEISGTLGTVKLRYRAHGAWPADFRHKIDSVAKKNGIVGVSVVIPAFARAECCEECPKIKNGSACYACEQGQKLKKQGQPVPSQFKVPASGPGTVLTVKSVINAGAASQTVTLFLETPSGKNVTAIVPAADWE